ncbi:hypothetical protein J4G08_00270 [Candidatus Poribacteria bacterium]|nr:hypothetical protein [Candidatus Poribacteria bacterium]
MLNKFNRILMILFIISVIGAFILWFISRPKYDENLIWTADPTNQQSPDVNEVLSDTPVDSENVDIVSLLKQAFTEEEVQSEHFQQFVKIVESPEYEQFLATEPTTFGSFFDFFESQGYPVNTEKMLSVFLNASPAGTPEQLEHRAYITLSKRFQQIPYPIRSPQGVKAFQSVIEEFLSEEENVGWMMTHFKGDYLAFGNWTVNVFRNPVDFDAQPELPTDNIGVTDLAPTENLDDATPVLDEKPMPVEVRNDEPDVPQVVKDQKPLDNPQEDIERLFKEEFTDSKFTDEEIFRGIQFLIYFGEDEGIKQLKTVNPEIAAQLERIIANRNNFRR